jgi:hypothetical protein
MSNGNMITRKFTIDGEEYKMFNLEIKGKRINVASYALDCKVVEMMEADRYNAVRHIDELYGYVLSEDADENNAEAIREEIEGIYEED